MKKIIDFDVTDNNIVFYGLINHVSMGKNSKSTYLSITVQDSSGEIDCKLWSATSEDIEKLVPGVFVEVKGDVIKYNESIQLKISHIKVTKMEPEQLHEYIRSAAISPEVMDEFFIDCIAKIYDSDIQIITESLYDTYHEAFLNYPAASKNHHEYLSGLAEHSYRMVKEALMMCEIYPSLDQDLMIAGTLLHDIGKVYELSGPVIPSYTFEGKLIGHITLGENLVDSIAKEKGINSKKVTLLKHILLSHHGKNEFGSPVLPMLPEAEMIYLIDNIDSKMNMIFKALDEVKEGEFTKRIFALDNRSFYKMEK